MTKPYGNVPMTCATGWPPAACKAVPAYPSRKDATSDLIAAEQAPTCPALRGT